MDVSKSGSLFFEISVDSSRRFSPLVLVYNEIIVKKLSLVMLLVAVAGLSQADLRSEIMSARHKQEKAAMARDMKKANSAMQEFMTSDFKYVQDGKTQDAKTFISNFDASMVMMEKITSSTSRIITLKENGSKGVAKVELKMIGTMKGEGKKLHAIDWTGNFTEEYRKVGGKWKSSKMTAGPQKFLMDGKAVKM